jgi:hypothetical protein
MTAYTDSYGFNKGTAGFTAPYVNRVTVFEIVVDFAKIAAARTAAGVAALAATDTLVLGVIPKGALILGGGATLITAEGATATADLGITGSLTLFASTFNLNATALTTSAATTPAYTTANTNIVMTVNSNNVDIASMKVSIAVINLGADLGTVPSRHS